MGIAVSPRPPARIHWTYSSSVSTIWMSSYTWNTDADYQTESNYLTLMSREGRDGVAPKPERVGLERRLDFIKSMILTSLLWWWNGIIGLEIMLVVCFDAVPCNYLLETGANDKPPLHLSGIHWCKLTIIEDVFYIQQILVWLSLEMPWCWGLWVEALTLGNWNCKQNSHHPYALQVFFSQPQQFFSKVFYTGNKFFWKISAVSVEVLMITLEGRCLGTCTLLWHTFTLPSWTFFTSSQNVDLRKKYFYFGIMFIQQMCCLD